MNNTAYYVQSAYRTMQNGKTAYLYIDENHRWTLDPTRIKFFDSMKRAEQMAQASGRICEIMLADVEEIDG